MATAAEIAQRIVVVGEMIESDKSSRDKKRLYSASDDAIGMPEPETDGPFWQSTSPVTWIYASMRAEMLHDRAKRMWYLQITDGGGLELFERMAGAGGGQ